MTTAYRIWVIHVAGDPRVDELAAAVAAEVLHVGLHTTVDVSVAPTPLGGAPTVAVFFGGPEAAIDDGCVQRADDAVNDLVPILPIVPDLDGYEGYVPESLRPINGFHWPGAGAAVRAARRALEELGIEERQRKVFISHKRQDGLLAAEQLFDELGHHGFRPFVDRFNIPTGHNVQADIADALEDYAFLLLLETPHAHESPWVFDEVEYALAHGMGLHIVTWPGDVPEVPATSGLDRQRLSPDDLHAMNGFDELGEQAVALVIENVETAHARSMVRRRRNLVRNVEDAAEAAGCVATPLGGWSVVVDRPDGRDVVHVAGRLPMVEDLFRLDAARAAADAERGVLVHAARLLRTGQRELLDWSAAQRPLTYIAENAIGGYW